MSLITLIGFVLIVDINSESNILGKRLIYLIKVVAKTKEVKLFSLFKI